MSGNPAVLATEEEIQQELIVAREAFWSSQDTLRDRVILTLAARLAVVLMERPTKATEAKEPPLP